MKKAAVLSITAFYLLLTSGMFVCTLHCAAAKAVTKNHDSMCCMGHKPKSSGKKDCCGGHVNYTVKENLKPATDFKLFKQYPVVSTPRFYRSLLCFNTGKACFIIEDVKGHPGNQAALFSCNPIPFLYNHPY